MASMDEFRALLPVQAAKAKYYESIGEQVAEWTEDRAAFTVTLYPENEWDVCIVYDNGVEYIRSDISASLPEALYRALRMLSFAVQTDQLRVQDEVRRMDILLYKLVDAIAKEAKP